MDKGHTQRADMNLAAQGQATSGKILNNIAEWIVVIVIAFIVSLLIRRYVVEFYQVPTGSMIDTIEEGDYVVGEKISFYMRSPEQGDIVTFTDPVDPDTTLIKRVIATGGQTVDLIDGSVYVDGKALLEPYTDGKESLPLSESVAEISYPYTVPEGYIWVMGDNRSESLDSRFFGAVPVSDVMARAFWTYWPLDRFGALI